MKQWYLYTHPDCPGDNGYGTVWPSEFKSDNPCITECPCCHRPEITRELTTVGKFGEYEP